MKFDDIKPTEISCEGILDGYESPIRIIREAARNALDKNIMNCIFEMGFEVDKEELAKALTYDRDQYKKGFQAGYFKGVVKGYYDCKKEILAYLNGNGDETEDVE